MLLTTSSPITITLRAIPRAYTILGNTFLEQAVVIETGGTGVDGIGAVATKRGRILNGLTQACAFLSEAGRTDATLTATGTFKAESTDSASFGMPVVNNAKHLYAGFTGSNTLDLRNS